MKSAGIPQIRVEPELRVDLESVLKQGETLTDFVEATVRRASASHQSTRDRLDFCHWYFG